MHQIKPKSPFLVKNNDKGQLKEQQFKAKIV